MLGDSSSSLLAADSGGDVAGVDGHDGGAVERDGGERGMFGGGGNRWPRQETLALLQIRSEMDLLFRDSSAKGPLWEEISRKLAELGYHRSAKKCKEKFENVYKYHKRTRETRTGKQDGKNYRFFDQLEAFDSSHSPATAATTPPQPPPQPPRSATIMPSVAPPITTPNPVPHIVTSTNNNFLSIPSLPMQNPTVFPNTTTTNPNIPTKKPFSNVNSTSSSTFSDDGLRSGGGGNKKKRKWKEFFERLMKDVMEKQDELQSKFLDAIERRERERTAREDSWRLQEMARINKERELLAQERSMAAAKDTAVMAFLQKLAEQQNLGQQVKVVGNNLNFPPLSQPPPAPPPPVPPQPPQLPQPPQPPQPPPSTVVLPPPPPQPQPNTTTALVVRKTDNGDNFTSPSPSRWPKVEVEALIQLRTNLDSKYLENGPKGPLWEEISAAMKRLGYVRSSKRCKEKWENINKYFKKVKESNKKRRDDAKTCPYFKQLDAIYSDRSSNKINMMDMAPLMVTPEQQWHPQQDQAPRNHRDDVTMDDVESDHTDDDEDGDDDEDNNNGGEYEVVANANAKPSSNGATATV